MRRYILSLFLLLMTDCSGPPSVYTVLVDPGSPILADVNAAAEDWEGMSGRMVQLNVQVVPSLNGPRCDHNCMRFEFADQGYIDQVGAWAGCSETNHCMAYTKPPKDGASVIYLRTGIDERDMRHVVGHEIGHAMGLLHDKSGTLMYPYPDQAAKYVTCADVGQLAKVMGEDYVGCQETR